MLKVPALDVLVLDNVIVVLCFTFSIASKTIPLVNAHVSIDVSSASVSGVHEAF